MDRNKVDLAAVSQRSAHLEAHSTFCNLKMFQFYYTCFMCFLLTPAWLRVEKRHVHTLSRPKSLNPLDIIE